MAQVEAHHRDWRAFFHPRIFRQTRLTAADYARFPRFTFEPEPTAAVLWRAARGIAIVGLLALALLAGGLRALRHYPVSA